MRSPWRYRLKLVTLQWPLAVCDHASNLRYRQGEPRILITRSAVKRAHALSDFLTWVREESPELARHFEFRRLPRHIHDWSPYALYVPWVGDLLDLWSPWSYRRAMALQVECRRAGVPIINELGRPACSTKSLGADLIRQAGVRTPRHVVITNPARQAQQPPELEFPLIVREDRGHGLASILVESPSQWAVIDWARFQRPVAVEFVNTQSPQDGLYRKYRYIAAGELGVARHLMANRQWEVRPAQRVLSDQMRAEEVAYVSAPDPNHEALQAARRALGLDIVGFDYSYDHSGRIVVWEANAFPDLGFPRKVSVDHIADAVRRSFAAVAHLYCVRAGLPVPQQVTSLLAPVATGLESDRAA